MAQCRYPSQSPTPDSNQGDTLMGTLWQIIGGQLATALQPLLKQIVDTVLKNLLTQLTKNLPAGTQMSTYVDIDQVVQDTLKELL